MHECVTVLSLNNMIKYHQESASFGGPSKRFHDEAVDLLKQIAANNFRSVK